MQKKIRFQIEGMTCQACASRIEKVLNKKDFVSNASVNFASEEAQIDFDDAQASADDLIKIIEKTGYHAQEPSDDLPQPAETPHIGWRLWLLFAVNVPFLIGMAGMMIGRHDWMMPPMWQLALASIVQLWLAIPFYKSAWASIRGGLANMDVLVTVGTVSIYLYSIYMMYHHSQMGHDHAPIYFEASVMVIGFVSLGKFLEHRTKKSSLNSLGMLLSLTPQQVNVFKDNAWQTLPLNLIQKGDLLRASQGERIAADGTVESGSGWADESHLTGESKPEMKQAGSRVLAGALVNEGSLTYRAAELGSQTLLGDMMNALSEAQGSKAPIARIADKAAAVFVPSVMGIALLTFIGTWLAKGDWTTALIHAVAVLVIACPCALGLATPAAIMAGMGLAVKHGIWFKDAAAMEQAAHIDTVVLDKTGTLTEGKPKIAGVHLVPSEIASNESDLYRIAAAVEQHAVHPLARAIVKGAQDLGAEIPEAHNAKTEAGAGVSADIDGIGHVKVGKPSYCGFTLPADAGDVWKIGSIVAVSVNSQAIGAFVLADQLKADSLTAVRRMQHNGMEVHIMSGDNAETVAYIAGLLNIAHAQGNMSPRDKAEAVQALKSQGKTVAMAGDGINDAPALAAADVSFAMKGGADVAEHTASATLMQHSANQLVDGLLIARATLKNIKQNLFFAFFYNILGIPLAAAGLLSPMIAGAAMACSSISVLGNALRLKRVKID